MDSIIKDFQELCDDRGVDIEAQVLYDSSVEFKDSTGFGAKTNKTPKKVGKTELFTRKHPTAAESLIATIMEDADKAYNDSVMLMMLTASEGLHSEAPEVFEDSNEALTFISGLLSTEELPEGAKPEEIESQAEKAMEISSKLKDLNAQIWLKFQTELSELSRKLRSNSVDISKARRKSLLFFLLCRTLNDEPISFGDLLLMEPHQVDELYTFMGVETSKKSSKKPSK